MSHSPRAAREHLSIIDPDAGKRYKLHIKGQVHKLTIRKVKHCLAAASSCTIPETRMVLKLNGVPLSRDSDVCGSLGILSGATLVVEKGPRSMMATAAPPREANGHYEHQPQPLQRKLDDPEMNHSYGADVDSHPHRDRNEDSYARGSYGADGGGAYDRPTGYRSSSGAYLGRGDNGREDDDDDGGALGALATPARRLLEQQTLSEQERFLQGDGDVRYGALRGSLARVDDALGRASAERRELEQQRYAADAALAAVQRREAAAAAERRRLADLQAAEDKKAAERAADLAARREALRTEEEHIRRVAQLKLANEKRRAELAQAQAASEAERRRADATRRALEAEDKHRQLALRAREIDLEHQRLALLQGRRQLLDERAEALQEKERMYARMGLEPPPELAMERYALESEQQAAFLALQHPQEKPDQQSQQGQDGQRRHSGDSASAPRITAASHLSVPPPAQQPANETASTSDSTSLHNHNNSYHHPNRSHRSQDLAHLRQENQPHQQEQQLVPAVPDGCYYDPVENAAENLRRLGEDLGLAEPLTFDEANTCVISVDGAYTLLVSYDAATERLFLYSTLLTAIPGGASDNMNSSDGGNGATMSPETAAFRLTLYEYLLEGSLLGRDMCGGGIGASLKNDFILMSTSLYMPTSQPWALRTVAPQFLQCLHHWRERVNDFMEYYQGHLRCDGNGNRSSGRTAAIDGHGHPGGEPHPVYRSAFAAAPPTPPLDRQPHQTLRRSSSAWRDGSLVFSREDFLAPGAAAGAPTAPAATATGYREAPVMGLEVTDTLLVNGVPTAYQGEGVLVVSVAGPAALAGVQPHDVLATLDGVAIHSVRDFQRIASRFVVSQVVAVGVRRSGLPIVLNLQIGSVRVPV